MLSENTSMRSWLDASHFLRKKEAGDLLSADGGAVVGVRAVSALESVSVSGGRAAGEPSAQPGVAPPLSAGPGSCG